MFDRAKAISKAHALFRDHDLLGRMTDDEIDELLRFAHTRREAPGTTLFLKGDPGDALYCLLSGRIKIAAISGLGREVILNVLGAGTMFGEIALLDGKPRTADATLLDAGELLVLERKHFLPFMETHPRIALRIMEVLCERVRWVSQSYEDAIFKELPQRLARKILILADDFGEDSAAGTAVPFSQQDLANMLGMTRESVNKQLQEWRQAGLLSLDRGCVTLHDRTGFAALVDER